MSGAGPSSARLVATLAVAGLVSGLVLAGVYLTTAPRIARNQAEALRRAIFQVLPAARSFRALERDGTTLVTRQTDAPGQPGDVVYACTDDAGQLVGYAIPASGPGFQDAIELIYGYDSGERAIVGMEVLASRETPGLGDKIATDPHFRANFQHLAVEPEVVPVKKGQRARDNEVDCITGATISSEAVVAILNRSTETWLPALAGGPPPVEAPAEAPPVAPAAGEVEP